MLLVRHSTALFGAWLIPLIHGLFGHDDGQMPVASWPLFNPGRHNEKRRPRVASSLYLAQGRSALTLLGVLAAGPRLALLFPLRLLLGLLFGLGIGFHDFAAHHLRSLQRDAAQQARAELVDQDL